MFHLVSNNTLIGNNNSILEKYHNTFLGIRLNFDCVLRQYWDFFKNIFLVLRIIKKYTQKMN